MEWGIRQGDPQTWPFKNDPLPSIHPSIHSRLDNSEQKNSSTGIIGGETMLSAPAEVISLNFFVVGFESISFFPCPTFNSNKRKRTT
jgi:hypothetical protein